MIGAVKTLKSDWGFIRGEDNQDYFFHRSTLSQGTLAVISGKMVKQSPEAMHVRTPSAIMGVRGTEFIVRVDR